MKVKLLHPNAKVPERKTEGAAGYDLVACDGAQILPGERLAIPVGISLELDPGTVAIVKPRSSLAWKYGIDVLAGVIDSDYRGEVLALLINHGKIPFNISRGDRIAQMIISSHESYPLQSTEAPLTDTERGDGKLGSTGR